MCQLRGTLLALCLASAAVGQGTAPVAAAPVDVRTLLQDSGCQTALPDDPGEAAVRRPERDTKDGGGRTQPRDQGRASVSLPEFGFGFGGLSQVLLWLGVGVVAVLLVAAVVRAGLSRRSVAAPARRAVVPGQAMVAASAAERALPDHERLAGAGDYAGAVHALLQQAIAAWVAGGAVLPSHATARDLLRRAHGRAAPVDAFASLVTAAERVHFGGRPADRQLYDDSRAQLQRWEVACRPRA